jgi:hypothetical protein
MYTPVVIYSLPVSHVQEASRLRRRAAGAGLSPSKKGLVIGDGVVHLLSEFDELLLLAFSSTTAINTKSPL